MRLFLSISFSSSFHPLPAGFGESSAAPVKRPAAPHLLLFDPDIHEAIGSSQDPVASPVLKVVYLKGYKLKNRVIRHAKVMVSMPDGTVNPPSEEKKETEEQK